MTFLFEGPGSLSQGASLLLTPLHRGCTDLAHILRVPLFSPPQESARRLLPGRLGIPVPPIIARPAAPGPGLPPALLLRAPPPLPGPRRPRGFYHVAEALRRTPGRARAQEEGPAAAVPGRDHRDAGGCATPPGSHGCGCPPGLSRGCGLLYQR